MEDEKFMQLALSEAKNAFEQGEIPVGAVVVCQNKVIARAHNLTELLTDVTAHAEMQAITSAANYLGGKYLIDCTLYVTVEPCTMCAGALNWAQISRIVFGVKDEKCGFSKFAPNVLHKKILITGGILEQECKEILQEFFRNKR
ncbi:MAG: nucleoside deaminase [Prevotellaceae bacterium]|jgi:tRNA(adenine34) deaminase|nr:nucleoside deaminase [Prevotellaceae bacterium]